MAFALTGFKAFGIRTSGSTRQHAVQIIELVITGTANDVALDLDTDAGTFWTAATGDATYGAMATQALADWKLALNNVKDLLAVEALALLKRVPIAALTGNGQYVMTVSHTRPNIALNAGDGDTAYTIQVRYALKDGQEAFTSDRGAAI